MRARVEKVDVLGWNRSAATAKTMLTMKMDEPSSTPHNPHIRQLKVAPPPIITLDLLVVVSMVVKGVVVVITIN